MGVEDLDLMRLCWSEKKRIKYYSDSSTLKRWADKEKAHIEIGGVPYKA